jgi:hypothetical protein
MKEAGVVVYHHPNPHIRSFLTSVEVFAPRVGHFKKRIDKGSKDTYEGLSVLEYQTVKDLMAIPGVEQITIKPREIRMTKGPSSDWEEIETKVVQILESTQRRKWMRLVKG